MTSERGLDPVSDMDELLATLSHEPGLAWLTPDARPIAMIWSLDGTRLIDSRGAAPAAFAVRWGAVPDIARHLRALGSGLAPRSGIRIERLRFGTGPIQPSTLFVCRVVRFRDAEVLLLASRGELAGAATTAARVAAPGDSPPEAAPAAALPLLAAELPPPVDPALVPPAAEPEGEAPRGRGLRFVWRIDAEGRFLPPSSELRAIVGERAAAIAGHPWSDLLGRVVRDESAEVAGALSREVPFARLAVSWWDAETDRAVPVALSGVPIRDPKGRLTGYRGFGMAFPDAARPAPPGLFSELPAPVAEVQRDQAPARRSQDESSVLGDAVQAAAALTSAGESVFGVLRAWFTPPGVVSLTGLAQLPGIASLRVSDPMPGLAPTPVGLPVSSSLPAYETAPPGRVASDERALSASERGALHEIARALSSSSDPDEARPDEARPDTGKPNLPTAEILHLPPRSRESELARILDRLPIGLAVLRHGEPVFVNRHLLDLAGHPDLPTLVAVGGLPMLWGPGVTIDAQSGPVPVEIRSSSGEPQHVEMRSAPIVWGDLPATIASLRPVPDPEAAQRTAALAIDIAASERRARDLATALEIATDGVVMLDGQGRILTMSASGERLFGYAANEIVGEGLAALIVPDDHRAAMACLTATAAGAHGSVQACEIRSVPRQGGAAIPLQVRAGRIADAGEAAFAVTFRNVAQAKAMEAELRDAQAAAEKVSTNRADFLARVSHEIRTPLTAIAGFAELMLEERFGPIGNERYRGYLRDIQGSGEHVLSLVNDLLDLAKASAGSSDLVPSSLDLNAAALQCVMLAAPIAARERAILRTSFAPGLPPVFADERSVRQIVLNLMSNAIRFTGAGGQVIVSTARGTSGDVMLRVRDTGPGMDRNEIEAALMPFRQVVTTRRGDGTGLGLPLSKALVEANGGVFTIVSTPQEGTLVEIRLPVAADIRPAVAAE